MMTEPPVITEAPVPAAPSAHDPDGATPLERALHRRLQELPFASLTWLVRQLLLQTGYAHVHLRRTRWKGHNSDGGWDLSATLESGLTPQPVLVQVKRLSAPVQGRAVDELRGVLLRVGAAHGLLVTTGSFSPVARQAAGRETVAAVTLIDGARLAALLVGQGIGVALTEAGEWGIDDGYFARLEQPAESAWRRGRENRPQASRRDALLRITVALSRPCRAADQDGHSDRRRDSDRQGDSDRRP